MLGSTTTVGELTEISEKTQYEAVEVSEIRVSTEGSIHFGESKVIDEPTPGEVAAVASLLEIPKNYLGSLPNELQRTLVSHHAQKKEGQALAITMDGELTGFGPVDKPVFKVQDFFGVVQRVFEPEDVVSRLDYYNQRLQINVRTSQFNTEPREGDVTEGGIQIIGYTGPSRGEFKPRVSSYLERLVCSNGMTIAEPFGEIKLRGLTVDEVIEELEDAARVILADNDGPITKHLTHYAGLTDTRVREPALTLNALAGQHGIPARTVTRMLDVMGDELEGDSMYDLVNFITQFQHHEGVSRTRYDALQSIGGHVIAQAAKEHKCVLCEHDLSL